MAMILSQRLILIFVFMNLIIGMLGAIYQNPTGSAGGIVFSTTTISNSLNQYEEGASNVFSDENMNSGVNENSLLGNTIVGNVGTTFGFIWKVIKNAINPFSLPSIGDTEITNIEKMLGIFIGLGRLAFLILAGFELWMLIYAKKTG